MQAKLTDGKVWEGVFQPSSPAPSFVLLQAQLQVRADCNQNPYVDSMQFDGDSLVSLIPKTVTVKKSIQTDTEISSSAAKPGQPRELKKWMPDADDDELLSLDEEIRNNGKKTKWNQFAGVKKSSFDFQNYSTKLDTSSEFYQKNFQFADAQARTIKGKKTNDMHIAEERGQSLARFGAAAAEDRWGTVHGPGKYVPPSQRKSGLKQLDSTPKPASMPVQSSPKPAQASTQPVKSVSMSDQPAPVAAETAPKAVAKKVASVGSAASDTPKESGEKKKEEEKTKKPFKLSAKAKPFVFNPKAKAFVPSFLKPKPKPLPVQASPQAAPSPPRQFQQQGQRPFAQGQGGNIHGSSYGVSPMMKQSAPPGFSNPPMHSGQVNTVHMPSSPMRGFHASPQQHTPSPTHGHMGYKPRTSPPGPLMNMSNVHWADSGQRGGRMNMNGSPIRPVQGQVRMTPMSGNPTRGVHGPGINGAMGVQDAMRMIGINRGNPHAHNLSSPLQHHPQYGGGR